MTKTALVAECIKNGMDYDVIRHIRSCYDGHSLVGCGVCRPCLNRAVALINNNIYSDELFDVVITAKQLKELITETEEYHMGYSEDYYADLKKAYNRIRQRKE